MRRLTRLLALLMAICLLCGAFSGCGDKKNPMAAIRN